ncbi:MAG: serine--tRNA ligase [Bacteroidales bacterium]
MLTLKTIQEHPEEVIRKLQIKQFDAAGLIEQILSLDRERRELQAGNDLMQSKLNRLSKSIGEYIRIGKNEEAEKARKETTRLKEEIKNRQKRHGEVEKELRNLVTELPNLPHDSVPPGKGPEDNVVVREWGHLPEKTDGLLPHWELGRRFGILDFELGNKLTGAGFPVFIGKGARLQRALIHFFLDEAIKAGYVEYLPPLIVNEDSAFATGQLPDKEGQMYALTQDRFYLIPTAEVPVTNFYRDMILDAEKLPVKNTAYTPCFRREAGSYGKDVRGLNRVHQFDKVEIVRIEHPDRSYEALEEMVHHVEELVKQLALPYRIVRLCGGDMSFTSALTYDFEVFAAAQQKWLEVSSVSNFESFQANRLKLRLRDPGFKKPILAHTLNGSALALPRIVAALLENNQKSDAIIIPGVLIPYTGFDRIELPG